MWLVMECSDALRKLPRIFYLLERGQLEKCGEESKVVQLDAEEGADKCVSVQKTRLKTSQDLAPELARLPSQTLILFWCG